MNDEIFEIFLTETLVLASESGTILQELLDTGLDDKKINKLFRCYHNMKGTSLALGQKVFSKLACRSESIIRLLKNTEVDTQEALVCIKTVAELNAFILQSLKYISQNNYSDQGLDISVMEAIIQPLSLLEIFDSSELNNSNVDDKSVKLKVSFEENSKLKKAVGE